MSTETAPGVQALAEAYADRYHSTGAVSLSVCGLCGYVQWLGTQAGTERRVTVFTNDQLLMPVDCPRCMEAQVRAPELFQWVLGVLHLHYAAKHYEEGKGGS